MSKIVIVLVMLLLFNTQNYSQATFSKKYSDPNMQDIFFSSLVHYKDTIYALVWVKNKTEVWKLDVNGNVIIKRKFHWLNHYLASSTGDKCMILDTKGDILVTGVYDKKHGLLKLNRELDSLWFRSYELNQATFVTAESLTESKDYIVLQGEAQYNLSPVFAAHLIWLNKDGILDTIIIHDEVNEIGNIKQGRIKTDKDDNIVFVYGRLFHDPDYHKIRLQLGKKDNSEAIYQVYESFIAEGKYAQAKIYLDAILVNDISDPYYKNQLLKYREVESILFDYYYAGNIKVNMPSALRQQLIDISETDNGLATHKARNILKELYGTIFSNYPPNTFYKPLEFLQNSVPRTSEALLVDVRPNPFHNLINISIRGEISAEIVSKAVLYDVSGQQKSDTRLVSGIGSVETKSLPSGVYFLKVFSDEKVIHVQKLVKVD